MALGFIASAIVPLILMSVLSFIQVRTQFRAQIEERLQWLSKSYSLQIYDRVQGLTQEVEAHLRNPKPTPIDDDRIAWSVSAPARREGSEAFSTEPLLDFHSADSVRFQATTEQASLSANISPAYFWWGPAGERTLPPSTEMVILENWTRRILFSSFDDRQALETGLEAFADSGKSDFTVGDVDYTGWTRPIQLRTLQNSPSLNVMIAVREDEAVLQFEPFRRSFPLLALSMLWLIALISLVQIRKTLVPLKELGDVTTLLSSRDYSARAKVNSNDEFEDLAESFNGMAEQIEAHLRALAIESEIDRTVLSSLDASRVATTLAKRLPDVIDSEVAAVALFGLSAGQQCLFIHENRNQQIVEAPINYFESPEVEEVSGVARVAARDVPHDFRQLGAPSVSEWLFAPIVLEGSIAAWLTLGFSPQRPINPTDPGHLRRLGDHAAVALSNGKLVRDLDDLSIGTMTALARAVDAKSPWTMGHSERVAHLARELGRVLGLPDRDLEVLYRGGLIHDVGKIGVPQSILDKTGPLTEEEMDLMKEHVNMGVRIVEPIATMRDLLPVVRQHHEWMDGSGYPNGLRGEEISQVGRIAAVADAFDAISSPRPYRAGQAGSVALKIIASDVGHQFDATVVAALERVVSAGSYEFPSIGSETEPRTSDLATTIARVN